MMPVAVPVVIAAPFVAFERTSVKLSLASTIVSPLMVTEIVFVVSPTANVSLFAAVR
jgi:hypothetical protein